MPSPPVLHTFDPQIAGKVGLNIDPQAGINQVVWYTATATGGPWTEVMFSYILTGLDALTYVFDADSTARYYQAKTHDSTGYSGASNTVGPVTPSAGPPAPPPPPTAQQDLATALGVTINPGDQIALYPSPSVVKTVQADGSVS